MTGEWLKWLGAAWQHLVAGLTVLLAIIASGHAVLYKRDPRAAVAWFGFIWLVPLVGPVLYFVFGVNRIRRRAAALREGQRLLDNPERPAAGRPPEFPEILPPEASHLIELQRLNNRVLDRPLLTGNHLEPLVNGDAAYPAMLAAIDAAQQSVAFATYIFDHDAAGREFAAALGRAVRRGVAVRVLVDDAGARYSWPTIIHVLKRAGVPVRRFLPTRLPFRVMWSNLRNHRKLLVVDGHTAFTGGLNIRQGHLLKKAKKHLVQDIHFRVAGPVVRHLQEVFAEDWFFMAREVLAGERWFPTIEPAGPVIARGIADGPDEDFEKLRWTLLGALAAAESRVVIVTPYFLPDQGLVSALNVAALRGVRVDILLPAKSNLPMVQWATQAQLWQVLERGCHVWLTPAPFDHSKLMVVDDCWSLIGSANWDPRSLRLNFEFNVECYDVTLARRLDQLAREKLRAAHPVTLGEVDGRPLPVRLRDGFARLFSPYL